MPVSIGAHHQTRHDGHHALAAAERHDVIGERSTGVSSAIAAVGVERVPLPLSQLQRCMRDPHLRQAFVSAIPDLTSTQLLHFGERAAAFLVVDGPAVIRIHEMQRPQLGALIEVGTNVRTAPS